MVNRHHTLDLAEIALRPTSTMTAAVIRYTASEVDIPNMTVVGEDRPQWHISAHHVVIIALALIALGAYFITGDAVVGIAALASGLTDSQDLVGGLIRDAKRV